ncbi:MAG: hypothetical protein SO251_02320 [Candidatus Fimisoma sp.]|nr:hypothetical protein [Bacillota bacterium]MDY4747616.1 hypothetical protein [Candidatus Fimisoma sp.]
MKKEKKNNTTELVFIIDRSGSMAGLEEDTVGGFNAMIEKQKKKDGLCLVTTVFFDNESEIIHDRIRLEDVPEMADEYYVRGCTALLDAVGKTIEHIGNIHKYARPEDVPANTIFIITTDGMENASHKFTKDKVKKMIERQKKKYGWEFIFIGANIDAVNVAAGIGIGADRAANYHADSRGTRVNFEAMSKAVFSMREAGAIPDNWKEEVDKDFASRCKKP